MAKKIKNKKLVTTSKASKDAEKLDHSCIAGGNVKLHSHSGKQFAASNKAKHSC